MTEKHDAQPYADKLADDIEKLGALGTSGVTDAGDLLESFAAPVGSNEVTMSSDEVTADCPKTGQPDFYIVVIKYRPNKRCIESKSLKLYLQSFRKKDGVFCEVLAQTICDHVVASIEPKSCQVNVIQKPRGGVTIDAECKWTDPSIMWLSTQYIDMNKYRTRVAGRKDIAEQLSEVGPTPVNEDAVVHPEEDYMGGETVDLPRASQDDWPEENNDDSNS